VPEWSPEHVVDEGLARRLPLRVPDPIFVGEPADGYPWPFFGAEAIHGREVPAVDLTHDARCALGRPLGTFLRHLHSARVAAELPNDPMGRSNRAERVPRTATALREAGLRLTTA
jgi:aminoglycoside phosphotransferase (APT) family kinase protein